MKIRHNFSRRELLKMSAGTLLSLGLWPGRAAFGDEANAAQFQFIAVNDIHFSTPKCAAWLDRVVGSMRSQQGKVDFCLGIGDLVDQGKREDLEGVRDGLKKLEMPVYTVIGNHDHVEKFDRANYEEIFPNRLFYSFDHQGWQFVGLNTCEGDKGGGTTIQDETLKWLDENMGKLDKKRPMILFTHFPMGPNVSSRPKRTDEVLERFKAFNLRGVLNGHYHAYTERNVGDAILTTNKCCAVARGNHDGTTERGFFVCSIKEGKMSRRFVEVVPDADMLPAAKKKEG